MSFSISFCRWRLQRWRHDYLGKNWHDRWVFLFSFFFFCYQLFKTFSISICNTFWVVTLLPHRLNFAPIENRDTEYVNGSFEIPHKLLIQRHANEVATSIPNLVDPDFLLAVHISQTDLLQVQSSTESVDAMSRRERSDPTSVPDLNVESSSCLPVCDPLASDSEFASSLQKSFDGELKGNHSRSTENPHLFYSGQICETDLEYAQLFQKQLNCEQSANLERHHSETSVDADALFAHLLHQQLNNDQSALFSESNPGDARTIANGKRPSDKNKRQERESEKNGCKLQWVAL